MQVVIAFVRTNCLSLLIAIAPAGLQAQISGASKVLTNSGGENTAYTGVARFSLGSTCTAFLIRTAAAITDQSPAYVLTNGHCLPDRRANDVVVNKPLTDAEVVFNYFRDTQDRQTKAAGVAAAYSTMKGGDIAIVQLGVTYRELAAAGIQPLELAGEEPPADEPVAVVGAPSVDIPREDAFLRKAECTLGTPRNLIEFTWNFRDAMPNACSDIKGGSSGSPVISVRTGAVVAIMNTTTAGAITHTGDFPCYLNQPCEVIAGTVHYQPDTNYALPVAGLKACFNTDGVFDLTQSGCALDPGKQLQLSAPARARQPFTQSETGEQIPARWDVELSGDAWTHYRFKTVDEASGSDCREPGGYGSVLAVAEKPRIDDPIPPRPGRYYLCVPGGNGATVDDTWQPPRFASMVHTRIDDTRPGIPITYQLRDDPATYVLTPYFVLPELVWFSWKADTSEQSTCGSDEGYRPWNRVPVRIPKDSGTKRLCLYGEDEAGNRTATLEMKLQGTSIRPDGVVNAGSLQPVPLSGGSILTVLGVNLASEAATAPESGPVPGLGGLTVELVMEPNRRVPLPLFYVGRDQVNALLSDGVASSSARLEINGPNGAASAPVTIGPPHPGLFTAGGSGFGAPAGTAVRNSGSTPVEEPLFECGSPASCFPRSVPLPAPGERLTLRLPVTGIAGVSAESIDLRIGGVRIPVQSVQPGPSQGTQMLHADIGPDFGLRGYLPLTIGVAERTGNRLFVLLR